MIYKKLLFLLTGWNIGKIITIYVNVFISIGGSLVLSYPEFRNKTVFMTGIGGAMGAKIAEHFVEAGSTVIGTDINISRITPLASELTEKGPGKCIARKLDVTNDDETRRVVDETASGFGPIDILINCAGVSSMIKIIDMDDKDWDLNFDVNSKGVFHVSKYVARNMIENGTKGKIVRIASMAGKLAAPYLVHYSASKFAIRGFLNTLRIEHLHDGLNVMIFAPGYIATNIRKSALLANGSKQGSTPRKEEKMMTAEQAGKILLRSLEKRKSEVVLTALGKLTIFVSTRFQRLADKLIDKFIAKEG